MKSATNPGIKESRKETVQCFGRNNQFGAGVYKPYMQLWLSKNGTRSKKTRLPGWMKKECVLPQNIDWLLGRCEKQTRPEFRNSVFTKLVQNGVNLFTVQKLGRWKNTSMVMRHAHHYSDSLRAGIEVMDTIKPLGSTNLAHKHTDCHLKPYLLLVSS